MNEISLMIQSVCLEAAVGLMLFLAIGRLRNKDLNTKTASIFAAGLAVIGVTTSITHLGQPLRAFNSLLNLGSSWLSRETLFVGAFVGCCALYLVITLWKPGMKIALRVLEWAGAAVGLAMLFSMASLYHFASVPIWAGANTYVEYFTTAIVLGSVLYAAACKQRGNGLLSAVVLAALAIQAVSSELHMTALASSGSAAAAASAAILSANIVLVAVKWVLLFAGAGVFCLFAARRKAAAPRLAAVSAGGGQMSESVEAPVAASGQVAWISFCAVFTAAFLGKVLFFTSMVVSGIGLQ